jgi:DNA adenine methylase
MSSTEPKRLIHFTPLRYPGGKAKLAPFIKQLLRTNEIVDGAYAEPFAGGAGIALELLFQGYVTEIYINDVSLPIYAFSLPKRWEGTVGWYLTTT